MFTFPMWTFKLYLIRSYDLIRYNLCQLWKYTHMRFLSEKAHVEGLHQSQQNQVCGNRVL